MNARDILKAGIKHMEARAKSYDKPEGERSMYPVVDAFNAITGHELSTEEGWLFMIVLKLVRSQQGVFRPDNFEDGAAYFGLMGETAWNDYRLEKEAQARLDAIDPSRFVPIPEPADWPNESRRVELSEAISDIHAGLADAYAGRVTPLSEVKARFEDVPSILEPVDLAELMTEEREQRMDIIGQNGNDGAVYDALRDDGWTEWAGGKCPAPCAQVDVILRNGKRHNDIHAHAMRWGHINDAGDVVLYRVHKEASHE